MKKVHLDCGPIYLKDFINVDGKVDYFAKDHPDKLVDHITTIENYYRYEFGEAPTDTVADIESDIKDLPFEDEEVDQVIMLHVLEHFPKYEVDKALEEIYRILSPGGLFIVGVPDTIETAKLLANAGSAKEQDWAIRLLYGTQKDKYFHHYCGYTRRTLCEVLGEHGFSEFFELDNINFYPAIHLGCLKK